MDCQGLESSRGHPLSHPSTHPAWKQTSSHITSPHIKHVGITSRKGTLLMTMMMKFQCEWMDGLIEHYTRTTSLLSALSHVQRQVYYTSRKDEYANDLHITPYTPAYLNQLVPVSDLPGRRRLRSSSTLELFVPPYRLTIIGRRSFPVAAAVVWNTLPIHVQSSPSVSQPFANG